MDREPDLTTTEAAPVDAALAPRVCAVIAQALGQPAENVTLESNLMSDLGADSLDLLDVVFSLEQEFGIQITRGALERAARGNLSEEEFAPGGVVGDEGLRRLRELMPEAGERIREGLRPREIVRLFSVRTFARIVTAQQRGDLS
jgi:acyl carrier protein